MKLEFQVAVTLKEGLLDPQGKAVEEALPTMGWTNVNHVRVGKLVRMRIDAPDEETARIQADEVARRLLANPVIEDVRILDAHQMEEA